MTLSDQQDTVKSASFSPDGKRVVTVGEDNMVRVYIVDFEDLPELGREATAESSRPVKSSRPPLLR